VNAITGVSDCGKTAIINAFEWVRTNRPLGEEYRSDWGGTTSVKIVLDDHDGNTHTVLRKRNNQFNGYIINGEAVQAIGTTIPDEVTAIFNMCNVNVQKQLDRHFLLSSTAGEVAQHFNKMAHIDVIDNAQKMIKTWIVSIQSKINTDESNLKALNESLKQYEYLDKFDAAVSDIEKLDSKYTQVIIDKTKLESLKIQIQEINTEIKEQEQITKFRKSVDIIIQWISDRNRLKENVTELSSKMSQYLKLEGQVKLNRKLLSLKIPINELDEMIDKRDELQIKYQKLKKYTDTLILTKAEYEGIDNMLKDLQDEYEKEMPNVCPLCGKPDKCPHCGGRVIG
jgi:exonuclease SbcC